MSGNSFGPVPVGQYIGQEVSIDSLHPSQCAIRVVDDVVKCLRPLGASHPAHDPKAPLGVTRKQLLHALEIEQAKEKEKHSG